MFVKTQGKHRECYQNTGNLEILTKHREFGNFDKTQEILFAQVINSLILKVKEILIFAAKMSNSFWKLDKSAYSVMCM